MAVAPVIIDRTGKHVKPRSGYEQDILRRLSKKEIPFEYESKIIPYVIEHEYTPDLILPNGVIVEIKGFFDSKDRTKHLTVREQHPELDIRFLFMNANTRLSRKSKTTYGMWATRKGFLWAQGTAVPDSWLQ